MLSIGLARPAVLQIARDLDEADGVLDGLRARLILLALAGIALAAARRLADRPPHRPAGDRAARRRRAHRPDPGPHDAGPRAR